MEEVALINIFILDFEASCPRVVKGIDLVRLLRVLHDFCRDQTIISIQPAARTAEIKAVRFLFCTKFSKRSHVISDTFNKPCFYCNRNI